MSATMAVQYKYTIGSDIVCLSVSCLACCFAKKIYCIWSYL